LAFGAAPGGLVSNTTYYWQVRATNAGGSTYADGVPGSFWSFQTQIGPPGPFNKSAPAGGAMTPTSLTLAWSASANAVNYEYCLDTTNNSVCDGTWTNVGASLGASLTGLTTNTTYYWEVRANNALGAVVYADGNASDFRSFTTQVTAPGSFAKTGPANAAVGQATTLALTWGAECGRHQLRVLHRHDQQQFLRHPHGRQPAAR
jgi:hypothetical protein